ncbi:acyl carrier protein [Amycolatopsis xylanica]|uniref:Acyl carrier protein n=1 Tax=Amycolatopsis xylanica TaxID=589385 RepID=A0A1H2V2B3_9PSEU|nr:acyl carrier protein [Amycolatopsis xylanica]SDW62431.1 acyl carrier protein [Amycolatopsis xylanica]
MQTTLETEIRLFVLKTVADDMSHPLEGEVDDAAPLGSGGIDLDSLSLIELTMRLERRFGVEFPETDIEPLGAMSLGELVTDVAKRGAKA